MKVHKRKKYAEMVRKTVQNAANLADIRHELRPSELRVAKAFVGRGQYLKRIAYHSRGMLLTDVMDRCGMVKSTRSTDMLLPFRTVWT